MGVNNRQEKENLLPMENRQQTKRLLTNNKEFNRCKFMVKTRAGEVLLPVRPANTKRAPIKASLIVKQEHT